MYGVWRVTRTSGSSTKQGESGKYRPVFVNSAVYAIYDEGFEQNGAVVGFTGEFVDHTLGEDNVRSRGGHDRGGEGKG